MSDKKPTELENVLQRLTTLEQGRRAEAWVMLTVQLSLISLIHDAGIATQDQITNRIDRVQELLSKNPTATFAGSPAVTELLNVLKETICNFSSVKPKSPVSKIGLAVDNTR